MCRCVRDLVLWCGTLSSIFLLVLAGTSFQPQLHAGDPILHAALEAGAGISEVFVLPDAFARILGFDLPRNNAGKITRIAGSDDPLETCDLESMELESFFHQSSHRFQNRRLLNIEETFESAAAAGSPIVGLSSALDARPPHPHEHSQQDFRRAQYQLNRGTRYSDQFSRKMPAQGHFRIPRRPRPSTFVPYYQRSTRNGDPVFMPMRPYFGQRRPIFLNPRRAAYVDTPSDRNVRKSVEFVEHPKGGTLADEIISSSPSELKEVAAAPQHETPAKSSQASDISAPLKEVDGKESQGDSQVRQQTGNCRPGGCTCKDIVSFIGKRIPREASRVCDGRCDCPDCSDERDQCAVNFADGQPTFTTSCFGAAPSECTQCRANERSCTDVDSVPDRSCYSQFQECDGVRDCPNSGKDETGCLLLDDSWPPKTSIPLNLEGFVHRKIRGSWFLVCSTTQEITVDVAREVCRATRGPLIFKSGRGGSWSHHFDGDTPIPVQTLVEVDQISEARFFAVLRNGVWVVERGCSGTKMRVQCPSPRCGTTSLAAARLKTSSDEGSSQKSDAVGILANQPQEESAGVYTETNEDDDRIIGGTSVAEKDSPWIAAIIQTKPTGGSSSCSGFIFNPQWVVTAAHCLISINKDGKLVSRYQDEHFQILAGLVRLSSASPSTQIRHGVLAVVHEAYSERPQNNQPPRRYLNDVAMIKVNAPFIFNLYVNALCLPSTKIRAPAGLKCFLRGWGVMKLGVFDADHLQGISMRIHEPCTAYDNARENPDKQICATTRDIAKGSCSGDSGGPLVCPTSEGFVAEGIVSYGPELCIEQGYPTAFTKVSTYLDWISKNIAEEATGAFNNPEYLLGKCSGMTCDDGRCLEKAQICNGVYDCPVHGEDERNCLPPRRTGRFSPFL